MALVVKDRVKQFSTTSGTGTITLGATPTGFQAFSVIGDGSTTYYAIVDNNNGDWEVGLGTYTLSGTTLSRDTVLASSNSGSLVNFGSDNKEVFVTYPAEKAVYEQASGIVALPAAGMKTGTYTILREAVSGFLPEATTFSNNVGEDYRLVSDGFASLVAFNNGTLFFRTSASGTAGDFPDYRTSYTADITGLTLGSLYGETYASKRIYFATSINTDTGFPSSLIESDGSGNFNFDAKVGSIVLKTNNTSRLSISTTQFTATLPWRGQNGTVSAPAFAASADTNTGVYFPAADTVGITTGGVERLRIEADGDIVNKGVFYYNARTITASITLSATDNAMSIGPITISDPAVVTVPDGGNWLIS